MGGCVVKEHSTYGIVIALAIAGLFFAWSLADMIDRKTDEWERAAADRHAQVYERIRNEHISTTE